MSALTDHVSRLCQDLDRTVHQYRDELDRKANAKTEYTKARAKFKIAAKARGEATSDAAAETLADADDGIAALMLEHLLTEGMAAATKENLASLKERIGFGRSQITTEREADKFHSLDRNVA